MESSSVKLILMEPTGDIVNTVSKTYPISFPKPGWIRAKPEQTGMIRPVKESKSL